MMKLVGKNVTLISWVSLCVVVLLASSTFAANSLLYRYKNEKGVPVIDDHIPPKFVAQGYEVLNSDGSLKEYVPRQLSAEELLLRNTDESRARFQEEENKRLEAWDKSLTLRYSSIDDIDAAEKRDMRNLQIRISILKSNLISIKYEIEREQQRAADIERRGSDVPVELSKKIDTLRLEIADTEQSIAVRREEIAGVQQNYQRDKDRFYMLLDEVEMRRQHYQPAQKSNRGY
jgi:hypothetical protein